MIVIGVDPGATGAVVAIDENREMAWCNDNECEYMPKAVAGRIEGFLLAGVNIYAFIEHQQYMAKGGRAQGAKSAFSLGRSYGWWLGFFSAFDGVKVTTVPPQRWQRYHYGSGTIISDPKERAIRAVREKLPELVLIPNGKRAPRHGRADAALIALYGLAVQEEMG